MELIYIIISTHSLMFRVHLLSMLINFLCPEVHFKVTAITYFFGNMNHRLSLVLTYTKAYTGSCSYLL